MHRSPDYRRSGPELRPEDLPRAAPDGFLPPFMYVDPRVLNAELRDVFATSWCLVGDVSGLTEPGDYLTETLGRQPVVVLRDSHGDLRAFANVCRHRGCTLLGGVGNTGQSIVCPYHNWTYDLHGSLRGVPLRNEVEGGLDRERLGLHELRLSIWERFAFVDLSGGAAPFEDCLGSLADELSSHRITEMPRLNTLDEVLYGNWKVHVDNAYCAYHFAMVHPTTLYPGQARSGITTELSEYAGCVYIPSREVDEDGDNPWGIEGRASRGSLNIALFPNLFIGALPNGRLTVLEWTPVSVEETRLRAFSYGFATGAEAAAEPERQRRVLAEDFDVVRRTHDGMRSPLYRQSSPRHRRELRIHNFQRRLVELLRSGAERQEALGERGRTLSK